MIQSMRNEFGVDVQEEEEEEKGVKRRMQEGCTRACKVVLVPPRLSYSTVALLAPDLN